MPLESNINGIQDLNPAWPTGVDPVSEGDNHVRNTKDAVLKSFPGMTASWTTSSGISCASVSVNGGMLTDLGVPVNNDDAARYGDILARDASIADLDIRVSSNESSIDQIEIDLQQNTNDIQSNTDDIAAIQNFLPFSFEGGSVNGANGGALGTGSGGYTSSRISTGYYNLEFTNRAGSAFNHVVVANPITESNSYMCAIEYVDNNTVRVRVVRADNGNVIDNNFTFWRIAFEEGL